MYKLLTAAAANTKTAKDDRYTNAILHLPPLRSKGKAKKAPTGDGGAFCWQYCLDESGRGVFANVQAARQRRAAIFEDDRQEFKRLLWRDLAALCRRADRNGNQAACRLNGTSDLQWENIYPTLFTEFSEIRWYDYTKLPKRVVPTNYHLTYSLQFIRSAAAAVKAAV